MGLNRLPMSQSRGGESQGRQGSQNPYMSQGHGSGHPGSQAGQSGGHGSYGGGYGGGHPGHPGGYHPGAHGGYGSPGQHGAHYGGHHGHYGAQFAGGTHAPYGSYANHHNTPYNKPPAPGEHVPMYVGPTPAHVVSHPAMQSDLNRIHQDHNHGGNHGYNKAPPACPQPHTHMMPGQHGQVHHSHVSSHGDVYQQTGPDRIASHQSHHSSSH